MPAISSTSYVSFSHLKECPAGVKKEYATLADYSKASAREAAADNVWVGHAGESNVLVFLRDTAAAIMKLDQHLADPLPKQIATLTALKQKLNSYNTFAGDMANSGAFWGVSNGMSNYLGERIRVTARATSFAELHEGLRKLNGRAMSVVGTSPTGVSANAQGALRGIHDTLIDYLKHSTAFLK